MVVIRCDLPLENFIVWKHPQKSPSYGSQILVSQSQESALFASGELVSLIGPGSHTLETANIPGIKNFLQDGDKSLPFDIWFVNKTASTNFNWGTKTPVQVKDKEHGLLVPLGSYGNYELQIKDIQKFILQIVGVNQTYSSIQLRNYFYPLVERETKDAIAELAAKEDIFSIATQLNEISEIIKNNLSEKFKTYGIQLKDFFVQNLSIISNDPSFEEYKKAMAESIAIKTKAKAITDSERGYKTERTLDVLEKLAENENGAASAFAGAGLGLGAGLNLGNQIGEITKNNYSSSNNTSIHDRLKTLKDLYTSGILTQEEFDEKKKSILDEL